MSMQPRANHADTRRRYSHQGYDTTCFGKAIETGPSGINMRLQGTHRALVTLTGKANVATSQRAGDLTFGVIATGMINHLPMAAGTLMKVSLPAFDGRPEVVLVAAADLTTVGPITLDAPIWEPIDRDRPLDVTVTGGGDEMFAVSLEVSAIIGGWF